MPAVECLLLALWMLLVVGEVLGGRVRGMAKCLRFWGVGGAGAGMGG